MKKLASGLAVAVITWGVGCTEPKPRAEQEPSAAPRQVNVLSVQAEALQGTEEVVGTVQAKLRATLEAKVSGRITQISVKLGDRVIKDQLLVVLEVGDVQAKLAQAEAVLNQATIDKDRHEKLVGSGAASQQQLDDSVARFQVARASVREIRSILDYARVRAPFSGVVTHKLAEVGDLALPGRPLLELAEPATMRFEVAVAETLTRFVGIGAIIPVSVSSLSTTLDGIVSEIAPTVDPGSRTLLIKLDLPSHAELKVGQFGRALIPTGRTEVLQLPFDAIVRRGQLEMVFVVADGRARMRLVKTGKRVGDRVEVVAGLDRGETIVTDGASGLNDGQPVHHKS